MSSAVGGEEIKFARVNATADGANTVIAAVPGKKLVVVGYLFAGTAAGTATLQDSGTPTVVGAITFTANQLFASYAGGLDAPAFEIGKGLAFVISNTTGLDTLGHISYIEV